MVPMFLDSRMVPYTRRGRMPDASDLYSRLRPSARTREELMGEGKLSGGTPHARPGRMLNHARKRRTRPAPPTCGGEEGMSAAARKAPPLSPARPPCQRACLPRAGMAAVRAGRRFEHGRVLPTGRAGSPCWNICGNGACAPCVREGGKGVSSSRQLVRPILEKAAPKAAKRALTGLKTAFLFLSV